jgi:hypothetical protein
LFPPDDERLSLETCRGRKINTLKKVKKVRQVGCKSRIVLYEILQNLMHIWHYMASTISKDHTAIL